MLQRQEQELASVSFCRMYLFMHVSTPTGEFGHGWRNADHSVMRIQLPIRGLTPFQGYQGMVLWLLWLRNVYVERGAKSYLSMRSNIDTDKDDKKAIG